MQFKSITMMAVCCTLGIPMMAQQTFLDSSICDVGTVAIEAGGDNATLSNLCDKDDKTAFEADFSSNMSFVFTLPQKFVAKGVVVVAADDVACAPSRMMLYGRADENSSWERIGNFLGMKYDEPYTSWAGRTLSSKKEGYSSFKLEVAKVNGGNALKISELQILGYPESDADNIAIAANGTFSSSVEASNLWAIEGGAFDTPVALRNVKATDGLENAAIDYTFNVPTVLTGYSITTNPSANANFRPNTWDLMASNDGESWVTLDMRNNEGSFDIDNYQERYSLPSKGVVIDYAAASDRLFEVIQEKFYRTWGNGKYLIHSWNADESKINKGYNYWWMAHAVDAYTDAYMRTKKQSVRAKAEAIKRGMYTAYDASRQDLWNSFYDDMEWMAIACIRGYQNYTVNKDVWLSEAKQLFEWIWGGWSEVGGGGISWNSGSGKDSKNSCSNAPAIIIAARLYQITGEQHYLDKAIKIYEWMLTHSRFDDGFIKDGPNNDNRGWAFTYNQGTWVGGLMELYKITKDEKYRDIAVVLMDKCLDGRWYSPDGIMRESGSSDGGLFKGIYIRYIAEWVTSGLLDKERQYRYAKYLVENAKSLYLGALHKPDYTVMPNWKDRAAVVNGENNGGTNGDYHSSILLSGIFLFESVDLMRREGLLNDDYSVKNDNIGKPYTHYRVRFTDNKGGNDLQLGALSLYGKQSSGIADVETGVDKPQVKPVAGGISVSNAQEGDKVMVYAIDGRVSGMEKMTDVSCTIDTVPGVYVVSIDNGTRHFVDKVVVK